MKKFLEDLFEKIVVALIISLVIVFCGAIIALVIKATIVLFKWFLILFAIVFVAVLALEFSDKD